MTPLDQQFDAQQFANGYVLVDGEQMHAESPENFLIPPPVIKCHVRAGQFVELRIDSPRFSVHEDAPQKCECPSCNGEITKPVLRHAQPETLEALPTENVPSRGWGEDFWVQVQGRSGEFLRGVVDNSLVEARLHGITRGTAIVFGEAHILAVHDSHRQELVSEMTVAELKELAQWIASQRR